MDDVCGWILLGPICADADADDNPKSDPCADRIKPLHMAQLAAHWSMGLDRRDCIWVLDLVKRPRFLSLPSALDSARRESLQL